MMQYKDKLKDSFGDVILERKKFRFERTYLQEGCTKKSIPIAILIVNYCLLK